MKLKLDSRFCRALIEAKIKHKAFSDRENFHSYIKVDPKELKGRDRVIFLKVMQSDDFYKGTGSTEYKSMLRVVEAVWAVEEHGHEGVKLKNLEIAAQAITDKMSEIPRRWVFHKDDEYGWLMPYFFTSAMYHPPRRRRGDYSPAYVSMKFMATQRGQHAELSVSLYRYDLTGHPSLDELFANENLFFATEERIATYDKELANYRAWTPQIGMQFIGGGHGYDATDEDSVDDDDNHYWGYWRRTSTKVQLIVDGEPAKLVMDDQLGQGDDNNTVTYALENDSDADEVEEEEEEEWDEYDDPDDAEDETPEQRKLRHKAEARSKEYELSDAPLEKEKRRVTRKVPTHPIVRLFNLTTHSFLTAHVSDLTPYPYNPALMKKLVLPQEHKLLIDALTDSAITRYSDIISGKATGVIILCSGTPGTGKTLTAEVYSEVAKRPLYLVQCSQLGTSSDALEKALTTVLKRATRWNAILLIDEADVYIHERGSNMEQNAIVGVFLRLLEYYQGILFMTTNRATVIDDAIVSRMTAHIRYKVPDGSDRNLLWHILSQQYEVNMSEEMVTKAVEQFPKISGRSIRQIIRLAKFMAEKMHAGRVTLASLQQAAKFHNFSDDEKMADGTVKDVQAHR